MPATLEHNLTAWNAAFGEYVKVTSKSPQEALEHKVAALGIALWKGFTAHQFGGVPRNKGVALAELAARTADGKGTRVRPTLLAEYNQIKQNLQAQAKALKSSLRSFGGTLNQWSGIKSALDVNRKERVSAWANIVQREVEARQSGIGELGAAFLWYRNRGKGENRRQVLNRRGKAIGSVEVSDGLAIIAGNVDGLTTVDARYQVVAQALADETDDTMKYVKEKQDAEAEKLARSLL